MTNFKRKAGCYMDELNIAVMQEIQTQLQEKHKDKWGGLSPKKQKKSYSG